MGENVSKAETQILAEEWTLAAMDVISVVKETIGVWSMPGSKVVEAAASGNTAVLPKQVGNHNICFSIFFVCLSWGKLGKQVCIS